jgi:hypothetical protein
MAPFPVQHSPKLQGEVAVLPSNRACSPNGIRASAGDEVIVQQ